MVSENLLKTFLIVPLRKQLHNFIYMKKTLISGMLGLLLAFPVFSQDRSLTDSRFVTDCEKSDFVKTPRYAETLEFCRLLAESSPMVHYTTFGVSPEGRELPLLIVDKDGLRTPGEIRRKGRVIILVESCIHSGEPDGKDATLILLRDMVIHKKQLDLLDNVSFVFIPIFNVDGHENFSARNRINQNGPEELGTRSTAQLLNLNRDFLKADAPEMRAWLKLYNQWMPELFIDVHVTNGADFQYVMTYSIETRGTHLEEGLRQWTADVYERSLNERMAAVGYPLFPYFSFRTYNAPESGILIDIFDPRYSQGYVAARNRIGLLIENHIYKPYKQRVLATIEAIKASARILSDHKESLQAVIQHADQVVGSPAFRSTPMNLEFQPVNKDSVWVDFLSWGRDTVKSDLSGGQWVRHDYNKPITVHTSLITSYEPTLSVRLPEAYLLMPQWDKVVELLDLHDIHYTRLTEPRPIEVETYRYTNATFATRQSEGRIPVKAEYTTQKETLTYPAGSILIDMNQPSARVAAWLLEPSAPGSLTYWGFFNQIVQSSNEFWISVPYMEVKGRELLEKDPALRKEFEDRKQADPSFAADPQAILNFFYEKVRKTAHQNNEIHPAWRIMERKQIQGLI